MAVEEQDVRQIWAEVIGIDTIEVDTDASFFDLGGTSFQMIKLVDALNSALDVETNIIMLLEFPTIEEFVSHCNSLLENAESEPTGP